nr:hypothetical protein [Mucilaginibacter sp. E4BP6]
MLMSGPIINNKKLSPKVSESKLKLIDGKYIM